MDRVTFGNYSTLSFPSTNLLNDLFSAPEIKGVAPNYFLGGGAGIRQDQLMENLGERSA
jgi:hypothetical protein